MLAVRTFIGSWRLISEVCICDPDGHWQSVSEKPTKEQTCFLDLKMTKTVADFEMLLGHFS